MLNLYTVCFYWSRTLSSWETSVITKVQNQSEDLTGPSCDRSRQQKVTHNSYAACIAFNTDLCRPTGRLIPEVLVYNLVVYHSLDRIPLVERSRDSLGWGNGSAFYTNGDPLSLEGIIIERNTFFTKSNMWFERVWFGPRAGQPTRPEGYSLMEKPALGTRLGGGQSNPVILPPSPRTFFHKSVGKY